MKFVKNSPMIKFEKDFGTLEREYVADGFTVKTYLPEMTEAQRIKADIQIRERVTEIGGERLCKQSM